VIALEELAGRKMASGMAEFRVESDSLGQISTPRRSDLERGRARTPLMSMKRPSTGSSIRPRS